jgi:aminomethyltransferase
MEQCEVYMKTALYDHHVAQNGKMVEFCGWEMPVQYDKGVIHEHHAVRNGVGIFDVSHMGRVDIVGPDAEPFIDYLVTNTITGKKNLSATYAVLTSSAGGCVDDVLVFKEDETTFFLVVNAGNRDKDLTHIREHAGGFNVTITPRYDDQGILALQGPHSKEMMETLLPEAANIRMMRFASTTYEGESIIISRTGYTGAFGYEIYASNTLIPSLWNTFVTQGAEPIGLGARDTLRMEMGFALYGHELTDDIAPTETVAAWTVKMNKNRFVGKEALEALEKSAGKRFEYGVILKDKGVAREGCDVYVDDTCIGQTTSGGHSPTLNESIAIILVNTPLKEGDHLKLQVRKRQLAAVVTPLPIVK